jgi:hypothetical protein
MVSVGCVFRRARRREGGREGVSIPYFIYVPCRRTGKKEKGEGHAMQKKKMKDPNADDDNSIGWLRVCVRVCWE